MFGLMENLLQAVHQIVAMTDLARNKVCAFGIVNLQ